MKDKWIDLEFLESKRVYHYLNGKSVEFKNIMRLKISSSGTHYLETEENYKYIVAPGWAYIELDMEGWTF